MARIYVFIRENMGEYVPDSIYECERIAFDDGTHVINWAGVWDIIRAHNWIATIKDSMKRVKSEASLFAIDGVDVVNYEVNYQWAAINTNRQTVADYIKLRNSIQTSYAVQPFIHQLADKLMLQKLNRTHIRDRKKRLQKETAESIKGGVDFGEFMVSAATLIANTSADTLLILAPLTGGNPAFTIAAGAIKGQIEYQKSGSLKRGFGKAALTTGVGFIPFLTKAKKFSFIVSLGIGGATGAAGESGFAYMTGGDIKKALITGGLSGGAFGGARSNIDKHLASAISTRVIVTAVAPSVVKTTALEIANRLTETQGKTVQTKLKQERLSNNINPITDNCLTEAMINGGCTIGYESFVREYAILRGD